MTKSTTHQTGRPMGLAAAMDPLHEPRGPSVSRKPMKPAVDLISEGALFKEPSKPERERQRLAYNSGVIHAAKAICPICAGNSSPHEGGHMVSWANHPPTFVPCPAAKIWELTVDK